MNNYTGLNNINSICYLNALLQSLLSCDTFVYTVKNNINNYIENDNSIGMLIYNIIYKIENHIKIIDDNYKLSVQLQFVGQNCVYDALILLIEKLNMENIFKIQFSKILFCTNCNHKTQQPIDTSFVFNYFIINPDINKVVNQQIESTDDNYICENCKTKQKQIIINNLVTTSDIFIILFNPYIMKQQLNISKILKLLNFNYLLVSQIMYRGNANNGHYYMIKYNNHISSISTSLHQLIDDSYIQVIDENNIKDTSNTYMLFYVRI
jgi:ubiquitin C-terminal hydrolase